MLTGIIAWLALRVGGGWASVIVYGAIAAILAGAVGGVWYSIHHDGYIEGVADGRMAMGKILQPQIDDLTTKLAGETKRANTNDELRKTAVHDAENLAAALATSNQSIEDLKLATERLQKEAKAALQAAANRATKYQKEIQRLQAIVDGPPLTVDTCREADTILRTLATERNP